MRSPPKKGLELGSSPAVTTTSRAQRVEPKLPHERDESSDPGAPVNEDATRVGRQAARDLARGLVDTGLGPVLQKLDAEHFSPPDDVPAPASVPPKAARRKLP